MTALRTFFFFPAPKLRALPAVKRRECLKIDPNCESCNEDKDCKSACYFCHPLRSECTEIPGCTPCDADSLTDCGGCGVCTLAGRCALLDASCEPCDKDKTCADPCQKCSNTEGPGKCVQKGPDCTPCGENDDKCPPCQTCKDNVCQLKEGLGGGCTPCNDTDEKWCRPCWFCNERNECERNTTCTPCKDNGECDACDVCNIAVHY